MAGDIQIVEFGHAKDDKSLLIMNYSIAYDTTNQEPLFYKEYAGSIVDIFQLKYMLENAQGYEYKKVIFFSEKKAVIESEIELC